MRTMTNLFLCLCILPCQSFSMNLTSDYGQLKKQKPLLSGNKNASAPSFERTVEAPENPLTLHELYKIFPYFEQGIKQTITLKTQEQKNNQNKAKASCSTAIHSHEENSCDAALTTPASEHRHHSKVETVFTKILRERYANKNSRPESPLAKRFKEEENNPTNLWEIYNLDNFIELFQCFDHYHPKEDDEIFHFEYYIHT